MDTMEAIYNQAGAALFHRSGAVHILWSHPAVVGRHGGDLERATLPHGSCAMNDGDSLGVRVCFAFTVVVIKKRH